MVFGTFDGLHEGHMDFFRQAKALAESPSLTVSIARDVNVIRIKGVRPLLKEEERHDLIEKSGLADRVVLGEENDYISHIAREDPDIIALGYDQSDYVEGLEEKLRANSIKAEIVRLKPYKENIFKNSLLRKQTGI